MTAPGSPAPVAAEWTYHGRQGGVQAGLSLTVVCIAVLVAAAVVDKAYLKVHPALQSGRKQTGHPLDLAVRYLAVAR